MAFASPDSKESITSLLLTAFALLFSSALASLSLTAVALLFSCALASLSLTATARESSSEEQVLSPLSTFVSPLLLTHTSPPCANAAPDRASNNAIIIAAVTSTVSFLLSTSVLLL
jgi:hypothetical protein